MEVLLTGATGYIGSAVAKALLDSGHGVVGLARSANSAEELRRAGCRAVIGDMRKPSTWLSDVGAADGVIHAAATFGNDMRAAEATLLDGLLEWSDRCAQKTGQALPLVYTGGCWLYGPVGDRTATEGSPFDPLPDFAFMVEHRERLFDAAQTKTCVLHPATVWDENGGAIARFIDEAKRGISPRIFGPAETRWPLVHRQDVARLYVSALELGRRGSDYHGVAETGVAVSAVAGAISARYAAPAPQVRPIDDAIDAFGSWAAGLALDQTMDAQTSKAELGWRPLQATILEAIPG